jgi:hypothetical protein
MDRPDDVSVVLDVAGIWSARRGFSNNTRIDLLSLKREILRRVGGEFSRLIAVNDSGHGDTAFSRHMDHEGLVKVGPTFSTDRSVVTLPPEVEDAVYDIADDSDTICIVSGNRRFAEVIHELDYEGVRMCVFSSRRGLSPALVDDSEVYYLDGVAFLENIRDAHKETRWKNADHSEEAEAIREEAGPMALHDVYLSDGGLLYSPSFTYGKYSVRFSPDGGRITVGRDRRSSEYCRENLIYAPLIAKHYKGWCGMLDTEYDEVTDTIIISAPDEYRYVSDRRHR